MGRPVVELLEALRADGTRIVYSQDVVPARLLVTVSATAGNPLDGLRDILAPHGLDVELGPRDTWLIVAGQRLDAAAAGGPEVRLPALIPPNLETVIVTASRYPIERRSTASTNAFGRHTIETTPALGQDPLRITHRLPGIASDQLTSQMHIRGGNLNEVLLRLDGVRLFSPYHLKDFQNIFSSINPRIIESMDVRTGGYEARYGDRSSGVVEMRSIEPTEFRHHELAVSFLDTSVLSSGLFADGRGAWVTALRRGNLDVLARNGDSDIGTPQYSDFFNKVTFSLSSRLAIETGMLSLNDKITLKDGIKATAAADYNDRYYWITLTQDLPSGLESRYRFVSATLDRTRNGTIDDIDRVTGSLQEQSAFDRLALSADWSYSPADSVWINWGAEIAEMDLGHRFQSERTDLLPLTAPELDGSNAPPADSALELDQVKRAVYAGVRYQPIERLITEVGLRWDAQSHTGEDQLSPRLNMLFKITGRTSLRAAWGEFDQSDSLSELAVADGVTTLRLAEKSRHAIVGLDHAFGAYGLFRIEIYEKNSSRLNRRFENVFERVSLLPELLPDRFAIAPLSSETRGIELGIEGRLDSFAWWANLALARTSDRLASGSFRRSWDERRAFKAGGEWSGPTWTVTTTLTYRPGWPVAGLDLTDGDLAVKDFNATRLPDFSSIDVRASRSVDVSKGDLEWFIEVSNLADHANYCCVDYTLLPGSGGTPDSFFAESDALLGIVPNLGIRWQF